MSEQFTHFDGHDAVFDDGQRVAFPPALTIDPRHAMTENGPAVRMWLDFPDGTKRGGALHLGKGVKWASRLAWYMALNAAKITHPEVVAGAKNKEPEAMARLRELLAPWDYHEAAAVMA